MRAVSDLYLRAWDRWDTYRESCDPSGDESPYAQLTWASSLASRMHEVSSHADRTARLNVMIPSASPQDRFAGVTTVLELAAGLSERLGLKLRVLTQHVIPDRRLPTWRAAMEAVCGQSLELMSLRGNTVDYTPTDMWVASYWTTAHVLDLLRRDGRVDPHRVLYLVQDYEPSFFPWSSDSALASATFHSGFQLVVNSEPLRRYLAHEEGVTVSDHATFSPALDDDRLAAVAGERSRRDGDPIRIFFYARPRKPRNLYPIGVAALRVLDRLWSQGEWSRPCQVEVVCAGGDVPDLGLRTMRQVGRGQIGYAAYYDLLAGTDIALSLMNSPHPSHPPLEMAVSGGVSVTNRFGVFRDGLHPGIRTSPAHPADLAKTLADVATSVADGDTDGTFRPLGGRLGLPLSDVLDHVANAIGQGRTLGLD